MSITAVCLCLLAPHSMQVQWAQIMYFVHLPLCRSVAIINNYLFYKHLLSPHRVVIKIVELFRFRMKYSSSSKNVWRLGCQNRHTFLYRTWNFYCSWLYLLQLDLVVMSIFIDQTTNRLGGKCTINKQKHFYCILECMGTSGKTWTNIHRLPLKE